MAGQLSLEAWDSAILDVDDTLVGTDDAVAAGAAVVGEGLGSVGVEVQEGFARAYQLTQEWVMGWRSPSEPELAGLIACTRRYQAAVLAAGHELKYWSRETMLAWAFERAGVEVKGPAIAAVMVRYWEAVRDATVLAPGAAEVVDVLRSSGVPFVFATNSDGVLVWEGDAFAYDPEYARRIKLGRLRGALEALGVEDDAVLVGDPVGKPTAQFAGRVMDALERRTGPRAWGRSVAIGDSYPGDIAPFLALGVGRGIWLRTRGTGRCDDPLVSTVSDLSAWLNTG